MKRILSCLAWTTLMMPSVSVGSILSDLARALPERAFVKLPANVGLDVLAMENSLLYYTDSGVWDPAKKKMAWVGGPGTCCADPAIYKRMTYDEATDQWDIQPTPFSGSGHGYDANALDPATGLHYFAFWDDKKIKTWNGQAWGALPEHPLPANIAVALSWFPDLNSGKGGLVLTLGNGRSAWFNGAAWEEIKGAEGAPWGEYEVFSEYSPALKKVWLGSGVDKPQVHYLLDAQLKLTRLSDAPFNIKNNRALKSVDPVSGKFLVYDMQGKAWWEFDGELDSWNELTGLKSQPDLGGESLLQVPLPEHGVILIFRHQGSVREAYLYRHSPGTATLGRISHFHSRQRFPAVSASASGLRLEVPGNTPGNMHILDLNGRQIANFRKPSRFSPETIP